MSSNENRGGDDPSDLDEDALNQNWETLFGSDVVEGDADQEMPAGDIAGDSQLHNHADGLPATYTSSDAFLQSQMSHLSSNVGVVKQELSENQEVKQEPGATDSEVNPIVVLRIPSQVADAQQQYTNDFPSGHIPVWVPGTQQNCGLYAFIESLGIQTNVQRPDNLNPSDFECLIQVVADRLWAQSELAIPYDEFLRNFIVDNLAVLVAVWGLERGHRLQLGIYQPLADPVYLTPDAFTATPNVPVTMIWVQLVDGHYWAMRPAPTRNNTPQQLANTGHRYSHNVPPTNQAKKEENMSDEDLTHWTALGEAEEEYMTRRERTPPTYLNDYQPPAFPGRINNDEEWLLAKKRRELDREQARRAGAHPLVPTSDAAKKILAGQLWRALFNLDGIQDNEYRGGLCTAGKLFRDLSYSPLMIELRIWDLIDAAISASYGVNILDTRRSGDRPQLTFAELWKQILYACKFSKALCKSLMDPDFLFLLVDDAKEQLKAKLVSQKSNHTRSLRTKEAKATKAAFGGDSQTPTSASATQSSASGSNSHPPTPVNTAQSPDTPTPASRKRNRSQLGQSSSDERGDSGNSRAISPRRTRSIVSQSSSDENPFGPSPVARPQYGSSPSSGSDGSMMPPLNGRNLPSGMSPLGGQSQNTGRNARVNSQPTDFHVPALHPQSPYLWDPRINSQSPGPNTSQYLQQRERSSSQGPRSSGFPDYNARDVNDPGMQSPSPHPSDKRTPSIRPPVSNTQWGRNQTEPDCQNFEEDEREGSSSRTWSSEAPPAPATNAQTSTRPSPASRGFSPQVHGQQIHGRQASSPQHLPPQQVRTGIPQQQAHNMQPDYMHQPSIEQQQALAYNSFMQQQQSRGGYQYPPSSHTTDRQTPGRQTSAQSPESRAAPPPTPPGPPPTPLEKVDYSDVTLLKLFKLDEDDDAKRE